MSPRDSEARDLAERAWDGASEALRVASRAESTAASLGGKLDGVERSVDELRGELRSRDAARLAAEERRGRATVAWIGAAAVVVASAIGLVGTLASSRSSEAELASQADVIRRAINQDRETRADERRQEAREVAQEALRLRDQNWTGWRQKRRSGPLSLDKTEAPRSPPRALFTIWAAACATSRATC